MGYALVISYGLGTTHISKRRCRGLLHLIHREESGDVERTVGHVVVYEPAKHAMKPGIIGIDTRNEQQRDLQMHTSLAEDGQRARTGSSDAWLYCR